MDWNHWTKTNESFKEIWEKSMARASDAFATGDVDGIASRYGVDRDEAGLLDRLYGDIENQLAVVRDRGKAVVFTLHFVKDHIEERHVVRTMDDWLAFQARFGMEDEKWYRLDYVYYAARASERTKGKCTVTISVE